MESNLKPGLSGIMRIKNEEQFIEQCIESCISALDELIIVYNDCTDNSVAIIERKQKEYPNKIRVYAYQHEVLGINLSKDQYELACSLPDDSPQLFCNFTNFAFRQASYSHVMLIDADQMYFADKLKQYANICKNINNIKWNFYCIVGFLFSYYLTIYRRICATLKKEKTWLLPKWIIEVCRRGYIDYSLWLFKNKKACLSFSGLNLLSLNSKWYVTLGKKTEFYNVTPPYNGEGEHLILVSSNDFEYVKFQMPYYNQYKSMSYSLLERIEHPYKLMYMGFLWFHLSSNRINLKEKISKAIQTYPDSICELESFLSKPFTKIVDSADKSLFSSFQRILFSFVHNAYIREIPKYIHVLSSNDNKKD